VANRDTSRVTAPSRVRAEEEEAVVVAEAEDMEGEAVAEVS
jgi:hypothetical protein